MSKLIENKQLVHIGSEIIVIIGLTFYFNNKNKKLVGQIEELSNRLQENEKLVAKHEDVIRQLVNLVNSRPPVPEQKSNNISKSKKHKHKQLPLPLPIQQPSKPKISFRDNNEDVDSDSDSDLDAEIAEELQELEEDE